MSVRKIILESQYHEVQDYLGHASQAIEFLNKPLYFNGDRNCENGVKNLAANAEYWYLKA